MPKPDDNELSARLRRLPGQLLLALVNGTAVLVIVAAVLALVVSSRVSHLAGNIAATMTDAVLSRVDVEPKQVLANIQTIATDIHTLVAELKQVKADGATRLAPQITELSERLSVLETSIQRLGDARSHLIDAAIAQVGRSLAESLENFRTCPADAKKPPLTPASQTDTDQSAAFWTSPS